MLSSHWLGSKQSGSFSRYMIQRIASQQSQRVVTMPAPILLQSLESESNKSPGGSEWVNKII